MHIVQRGISQNACFFGPSDYFKYLQLLSECAREFACDIHAYCLMTNHVHLLLTPKTPDACARFMKQLGQCYVQTINERMQRSGTLWEGRYYSCLLTSHRYVLTCIRYIELNPVRAGMVQSPGDYPWSSYDLHGQGKGIAFLSEHEAYRSLGETADTRADAYRFLCHAAQPGREVDEIRAATRVGCVAGTVRRGRGRPRKVK
ncbi:MAG TPA: transposase [Burkholderiales bacterium]|nr:transposase [Burkholderiales bacterium]